MASPSRDRKRKRSRDRDARKSRTRDRKDREASTNRDGDRTYRHKERSSHRRSRRRSQEPKSRKGDRRHKHSKKSKTDDTKTPDLTRAPTQISDEDYFLKSLEFRVWLQESKNKCFQAMNEKDQKKYFEKFCVKWNEGKLKEMYYDSTKLPEHLLLAAKRNTKYNWGFQNKLSVKDVENLDDLRHRVDRDTIQAKDERVDQFKARLAAKQVTVETPVVAGPSRK